MHPTKIARLDICAADLEGVVRVTRPPAPERDSVDASRGWFAAPVRWEPLEVALWEGSLADVNPAFVGVECVVATEV